MPVYTTTIEILKKNLNKSSNYTTISLCIQDFGALLFCVCIDFCLSQFAGITSGYDILSCVRLYACVCFLCVCSHCPLVAFSVSEL